MKIRSAARRNLQLRQLELLLLLDCPALRLGDLEEDWIERILRACKFMTHSGDLYKASRLPYVWLACFRVKGEIVWGIKKGLLSPMCPLSGGTMALIESALEDYDFGS